MSDALITGVKIALLSSDKSSTAYFGPVLFFFGFLGGLRTIVSLSLKSSSESLKSTKGKFKNVCLFLTIKYSCLSLTFYVFLMIKYNILWHILLISYR